MVLAGPAGEARAGPEVLAQMVPEARGLGVPAARAAAFSVMVVLAGPAE